MLNSPNGQNNIIGPANLRMRVNSIYFIVQISIKFIKKYQKYSYPWVDCWYECLHQTEMYKLTGCLSSQLTITSYIPYAE